MINQPSSDNEEYNEFDLLVTLVVDHFAQLSPERKVTFNPIEYVRSLGKEIPPGKEEALMQAVAVMDVLELLDPNSHDPENN